MRFYTVNNDYIQYLKTFDSTIPDNYNGSKAYIGIVLDIDNHKFLAPLTSYKEKQDKLKSSLLSIFKIHERINPENKLGMILLNICFLF